MLRSGLGTKLPENFLQSFMDKFLLIFSLGRVMFVLRGLIPPILIVWVTSFEDHKHLQRMITARRLKHRQSLSRSVGACGWMPSRIHTACKWRGKSQAAHHNNFFAISAALGCV